MENVVSVEENHHVNSNERVQRALDALTAVERLEFQEFAIEGGDDFYFQHPAIPRQRSK